MGHDYEEGGSSKPGWIKDPETGRILPIEKDQSWRDAIFGFYAAECKHEHFEPMRVTIADGRMQVMRCCTNCGERSGGPMSQKDRD